MSKQVLWLSELGIDNVDQVGGKNASLGEMIQNFSQAGVRVPGGFATTASAYRDFLAQNGLAQRIQETLAALDVDDIAALGEAGARIRQWIQATDFPPALEQAIDSAFAELERNGGHHLSWAVRSSVCPRARRRPS